MIESLIQITTGVVQAVLAIYGLDPARALALYGFGDDVTTVGSRASRRRRRRLTSLRVGLTLAAAVLAIDGFGELLEVEDDD